MAYPSMSINRRVQRVKAAPAAPLEPDAARYQRMTSSNLRAAILAGTEPQPNAAVLCSDGWLTFGR